MEFSVKSGSPEKQRSACIVVGVFEPRRLSPIAEQLDKISDGYISALLRRGELEGKVGQMYDGSLLSTKNGLWAKDGTDFIYIERVAGEKELSGVNIYHFNDQRRLETVRYAASATFEDGVWKLSQVDTSDLTNPKQVTGTQTLTGEWKTNLTPDKLGVVALDPTSLSISGLHNYVKYLKQSGQEANRYQLNMWSKVFSPLSVAVMMLMALSFIFGPLRSVPMGVRVVTGISFGFLFYVLDQIFGPLSLVYNMPPVLGALLPSMLFLLISVYMLLKRK